MPKKEITKNRILEAALAEFTVKGFQAASLRNIVKEAGVTTGAFYGYFGSKEELFDAITVPHAEALLGFYDEALEKFWDMTPEEQELHMSDSGDKCLEQMVDHCYDHPKECRLLFTGAKGTRYENFIHELAVKEIESNHKLTEEFRKRGYRVKTFDENLEHMIISGQISTIIEPMLHDISRDEARKLAKQVHRFYSEGWKAMMGID